MLKSPFDDFFNGNYQPNNPTNENEMNTKVIPVIDQLKNLNVLTQCIAAKIDVGVIESEGDGQFVTWAGIEDATLLLQDAPDGRVWCELACQYAGALVDSTFQPTVSAAIEWAIARFKEYDAELDAA